MTNVKTIAIGALLGSALFGSAANASVFDITFTNTALPGNAVAGGPYDISAVVEGTLSGSNYLITTIDSGSITIGTGAGAVTYSDIGLLPASSSPSTLYAWDSLITSTGGSAPFSLTSGGLLFTSASAPINGSPPVSPTEFNLDVDGGGAAVSSDNSNNVNAEYRGDLTITEGCGYPVAFDVDDDDRRFHRPRFLCIPRQEGPLRGLHRRRNPSPECFVSKTPGKLFGVSDVDQTRYSSL